MSSNKLGKLIIDKLSFHVNLRKELFIVDYVKTLYGLLVAIILSQNTNDKMSLRALKNLKDATNLDPKKIYEMPEEKIQELIRPAGLYQNKAKSIKTLAEKVISGFSLEEVLKLPVDEARKILTSIPGIGKKTADVFLAIHGKETIGLDTHALRVSGRLGLVPQKAGYEKVRKILLDIFKGIENYDVAHRYLIALGRTWCRAQKPLCSECPLRDLCKYYKEKREKT